MDEWLRARLVLVCGTSRHDVRRTGDLLRGPDTVLVEHDLRRLGEGVVERRVVGGGADEADLAGGGGGLNGTPGEGGARHGTGTPRGRRRVHRTPSSTH